MYTSLHLAGFCVRQLLAAHLFVSLHKLHLDNGAKKENLGEAHGRPAPGSESQQDKPTKSTEEWLSRPHRKETNKLY